jgi:hypothetical protein
MSIESGWRQVTENLNNKKEKALKEQKRFERCRTCVWGTQISETSNYCMFFRCVKEELKLKYEK